MLGLALGELAPLLGRVHVPDHPVTVRVRRDRLEPAARDRPHAVRGDPHLDARHAGRPLAQRLDAGQERLDIRVAEAPLTGRRRRSSPSAHPPR